MSNLYERHLYLDKSVDCLLSTHIREYDMKSAGFSILKREKLAGENFISYLSTLDKKQRNVQIGLYTKANKDIIEKFNNGFVKARKEFFEMNEIEDSEVLSIKKDAIFLINRIPEHTKFKGMEFVLKNSYSSYYYLNKIEFYFKNMGKKLDVKGISDEDLIRHEKYILNELKSIFSIVESGKKEYIIKRLKKFAMAYKNKELDYGFYRELNQDSLYRIKSFKVMSATVGVNNIDSLDNIDISYNYLHYIIPLIRLLY